MAHTPTTSRGRSRREATGSDGRRPSALPRRSTDHGTPRRRLRRPALAAAALAVFALAASCAAPPTPTTLPVGGLGEALVAYALSPGQAPGANDWSCRPSAAHPRPVVLVHGTVENLGFNWATLSPLLKNAGYCVFGLNYGEGILSLFGRANGLNSVTSSAGEVSSFIDRVLNATGATKVDFVGHSQGGLIGTYYTKRMGGASKVVNMVQLAPSNHGTTLSGLTSIGSAFGVLGIANLVLGVATPSLVDQQTGSSFQTSLFADGDVVPGPRYTVIETSRDEVVTPYTNAFLTGPNVTNILIQDQCPDDPTGHVGLAFDRPALANVLNVLGANTPGYTAPCAGYGMPL